MNLKGLLDGLPELSPHDRSLVERAWQRAEQLHQDQRRKSGEPFFTHCVAVARILAEIRMDAEAIAAGLLHDTLEDTGITLAELEREFGGNVVALVDGVTRLSNLPLSDTMQRRSDRDQHYLRKMMLAMGDDVRVVLVKLADRLHNMRTLGYMPPEKQLRIARDTMDFFAPLANLLGIWQFKWELEDLSFRYLHPQDYRRIATSMNERRVDREQYLQMVTERLREELAQYNLDKALISVRPKHIYSIYSKMMRKQLPFEQIYDVRALRVIVESTPECYLVLGIVHNLWRPIPVEFDDYIASPKDNFYQSLHTAVLDSRGKTLEVQIRTRDMHEHAEYGIAAHWRYKEGVRENDREYERRVSFLRRLMEFGPEEEDPEYFVNTMKSDVLKDRVYAFTPKGDICDLPAGATPIDFAYHIHTDIGHRCRGARVHGRLVSLDHVLQTGDQVEILTSRYGGPSLDWLNPDLGHVQTSRARNKIKLWFRRQNRDRHLATGRDVLERELRRLGLLDSMSFDFVAGLFDIEKSKLDDFLVKIGAGDINSSRIANRILESERQQEKESLIERMLEASEREPQPRPAAPRPTGAIDILGTGGLLVNLASCCNPMPGDGVVGYITRGRGVTVHREDCSNMRASTETERMVEVSWGQEADEQRYPVPVEVTAWDREGLLRDVSSVVTDAGVNMSSVHVVTSKNIATLKLTIEIRSAEQLMRILTRLEGIKNVIEARRHKGN